MPQDKRPEQREPEQRVAAPVAEAIAGMALGALARAAVPAWAVAETKAKEAIEAAMFSHEFGGGGLSEAAGNELLSVLDKVSAMAKVGKKTRKNLGKLVKKVRDKVTAQWSAVDEDERLVDPDDVQDVLEDFQTALGSEI